MVDEPRLPITPLGPERPSKPTGMASGSGQSFSEWLRRGNERDQYMTGDQMSFGEWVRQGRTSGAMNDQERTLAQYVQDRWSQLNRTAGEAVERLLHGPRKVGDE